MLSGLVYIGTSNCANVYTKMPRIATKRWFFTTFDTSSASFQKLFDLEDDVDYLVCGFMRPPHSQEEHFNVFVRFKRRVRVKFLKDRWPDCEAFKCFCSPYEVMMHCKRTWEYCELGEPPVETRASKRARAKSLEVNRKVRRVYGNPDRICISLDVLSSTDV